jgi:hypothetical protein
MNLDHLALAIGRIHVNAQRLVGQAVNRALNWRNWLMGAYIFEYEKGGEDRAEQGGRALETLARRLKDAG